MSIPGFLEVQDGVDFTLGKELARGGGGAVYLGEAFNPEIIRRAQTKQIVVKRVFGNAENPQESDNTFYQEVAIMWLLSGRNISKVCTCASQDSFQILEQLHSSDDIALR